MIVAQLTDTHIVARGSRYFFMDSARYLRQAIAFLNAMRPKPDLVFLSGDVTNLGRPREYAHLRECLDELTVPWFVIPGNHDRGAGFREAFADRRELGISGAVRFVVEEHPVRVFGLDTAVCRHKGGIGGGLDEASLDWLEAEFARDERPALVFLHHPPFMTGMRYMDFAPFVNLERFWELLLRRRTATRVAAGHVHSVHTNTRGNILALTSRSTTPQIVPEVLEKHPFWFRRERPGFTAHSWHAERGFESHDYRGDGRGAFEPALI